MNKLWIIVVVLFVVACTLNRSNTGFQADSWQDVQQRGHGDVTLKYVPSDGFSYTTEDGELTGVTIELFRDFVDFVNEQYETDISIHFRPIGQFSTFYDAVKQSESGVFGVANVTITEERKNELRFSPPYMTNIAVLITHEDTGRIESIGAIETRFGNLRALAFEGTLHQVRLEQILEDHLPDSEMDFAGSNNEIIERTAASNRYFAYVDVYNYWRAAGDGMPLRRHPAGDEASEQFGVIMPLDTDWGSVINEFFTHNGGYIHSARYSELMEKHLGNELAALLLNQEP